MMLPKSTIVSVLAVFSGLTAATVVQYDDSVSLGSFRLSGL